MDTAAWLDQHDAWMTETIRRHCWAMHYIGGECCSHPGCDAPPDDEPPFAYTPGLLGLGHPELLILDVDPPTTAGVLSQLTARVKQEEHLARWMPVDIDGRPHRVVPTPVSDRGAVLFEANRF